MLDRCHVRTLENVELLHLAADRWERHRDQDALEDARAVSQFLSRSASRHERDEEESVFPRLTRSPGWPRVLRVLTAEHRDHEREIAVLKKLVTGKPDPDALSFCARRLVSAYRAHVALEDAELTPRLRQLTTDELDTIFSEMQARRGR